MPSAVSYSEEGLQGRAHFTRNIPKRNLANAIEKQGVVREKSIDLISSVPGGSWNPHGDGGAISAGQCKQKLKSAKYSKR